MGRQHGEKHGEGQIDVHLGGIGCQFDDVGRGGIAGLEAVDDLALVRPDNEPNVKPHNGSKASPHHDPGPSVTIHRGPRSRHQVIDVQQDESGDKGDHGRPTEEK